MEPAAADWAGHRPRRGQCFGGYANCVATGALLPGFIIRNVRADPGSTSKRSYPVLSSFALWRGEAVRALDDGELSRELRLAYLIRHPVQSREPVAGN